jgi:hypothetical protein
MKKPALFFVMLIYNAMLFAIISDASYYNCVKLKVVYEVTFFRDISFANLTVKLPDYICGRQQIKKIEYSQNPYREIFIDGKRYAQFIVLRKSKEQNTASISIIISAKLLGTYLPEPKELDSQYYDEEHSIDSYEDGIQRLARELRTQSIWSTASNIKAYINDIMKYERRNYGVTASEALKTRIGDCTEYSELFVALMRAAKYPARFVSGISLGLVPDFHDSVEMHVPQYGWLPIEPMGNPTKLIPPYYAFLKFSSERNDPILKYNEYCRLVSFDNALVYLEMKVMYAE